MNNGQAVGKIVFKSPFSNYAKAETGDTWWFLEPAGKFNTKEFSIFDGQTEEEIGMMELGFFRRTVEVRFRYKHQDQVFTLQASGMFPFLYYEWKYENGQVFATVKRKGIFDVQYEIFYQLPPDTDISTEEFALLSVYCIHVIRQRSRRRNA